jgi:hypothetical protein
MIIILVSRSMPTFLVLLISMQCFVLAQRQSCKGQARGWLVALGITGLGVGLLVSALANGIERGLAAWLASMMAAGLLAPLLGTQIPRLQTALRRLVPLRQRLQASFK